jgi:Mn2+/Fe2+ NRAMP family transporter
VINGIVLPFVLIFMLLLINDKKLMMGHTNGFLMNAIAWTTSLTMIGLSILLLIRAL